MRDSPFDMTAAGRSPLVVLPALLVALVLVLAGRAGPAGAQTTPGGTTGPAVTSTAPSPSTTAATAGDVASTRTVNRIVIVLVVFAVVLVGVAIWFWRATKPLPRHLDGLDVMGTRKWRDASSGERSTLLAPVHERRADIADEEEPAEPEPMPAGVEVAADPSAESDAEETPRAS